MAVFGVPVHWTALNPATEQVFLKNRYGWPTASDEDEAEDDAGAPLETDDNVT